MEELVRELGDTDEAATDRERGSAIAQAILWLSNNKEERI